MLPTGLAVQLLVITPVVFRDCVFHQHAEQMVVIAAGGVIDYCFDFRLSPALLPCGALEVPQQVECVAVESYEGELYSISQVRMFKVLDIYQPCDHPSQKLIRL